MGKLKNSSAETGTKLHPARFSDNHRLAVATAGVLEWRTMN